MDSLENAHLVLKSVPSNNILVPPANPWDRLGVASSALQRDACGGELESLVKVCECVILDVYSPTETLCVCRCCPSLDCHPVRDPDLEHGSLALGTHKL